jgi:hypothetical protein
VKGKILLIGTAALLLGVAVLASDVWKDKPYQSWDQKDVQKVMGDSPWAQKVEIGTPAGGGANDPAFSPTGNAAHTDQNISNPTGMNNRQGGNNPTGADQMGGGGQQVYLARWLSSRTIREAIARGEELNGKAADEATKSLAGTPETYQVLILSRNLRPFQTAGEDALKSSIYLETKKSHEKIMPSKVDLVKGSDGQHLLGVVVEFPKKSASGEATLASDEKGADFVADAGNLKLKFHFDFSKMQDKQGLDL